MQIKELNIENFKGITSLVIKPTKINIIVGKNNTGKTSLLEAMDLLFNNEDFSKYGNYLHDIINYNYESSEIKAKIINGDTNELDLKIEKADFIEGFEKFKKEMIQQITSYWKKNPDENPKLKETELDKIFNELIDEPEIKDLFSKNLRITRGNIKEILNYYFISDYRRYILPMRLIDKLFRKHNIKIGFLASALTEKTNQKENADRNVFYIRRLLQYKIDKTDVKILDRVENIIKEKSLIKNLRRLQFDKVLFENEKEVAYLFLGDGFKALVALLWELSSDNLNNNILLLDEPDIHLHPGYINELIRIILTFAMEFNIQFFIATHNSDFISEILEGEFTKEQKKFLEKEFTLFKMDSLKGLTTVDKADYKKAIDIRENLLLDLRGT